ncbi:MAG: SURF1 family protein [Woeseiaceae bacterium]|nr:SURF1 family protein [Woeseiaceae bacterium]
MNTNAKKPLPAWLPLLVGSLLVIQFAGLGVWQVSRGLEKAAEQEAFSSGGGFTSFRNGTEVRSYQPIKATGRFDGEHQFLLDNIILNNRYGYYVVTALELDEDEPLLLVNRGWIEKPGLDPDIDAVAVGIVPVEGSVTVRGRVGSLPRPGMRMGDDAIADRSRWPQVGVYPTSADLEKSLGRPVEPFVLLMDPDDEGGFLRHWVPPEMGPSRHYGYAFQWFAMALVLAGLLVWHTRKRGFK